MELGTGWGAAAMASLAAVASGPPFFAARGQGDGRVALAIGTYVAVTILVPAFSHFPVPVLGQGASPIIGYFAALGLL